jgi:FixJ family two-component response regulator
VVELADFYRQVTNLEDSALSTQMIPARIALVDDDPSIRRGVARMLELSGLRVTTFASAEALMADDPGGAFDCLVLDIHLPGLSGPECYGGLRARGGAPPAVFITAHDVSETQDMLQRVAPATCLRKPFRSKQLLEAIRDALGTVARRSGRF